MVSEKRFMYTHLTICKYLIVLNYRILAYKQFKINNGYIMVFICFNMFLCVIWQRIIEKRTHSVVFSFKYTHLRM